MFPGIRDRVDRFVYDGFHVARTGDPGRMKIGTAALACALVPGCFSDPGAGPLCAGAACLTGGGTSGGDTTGTTTTTTPTTTGASETTGAPFDPSITLRISTMAFVDPHLFITEEGMDTDTGTGGAGASCVNDVTMLVNGLLNSEITDGKFNLLLRFEDFAEVDEVRLLDAACEPPAMAGAQWICTPGTAPTVNLTTQIVAEPGCRNLEPDVYRPVNLPMINDPTPPCMRTTRGSITWPVSGLVGSLDLREAQVVAMLDDAVAPSKLIDGVVYGFLPMSVAQNLQIDAPLFGLVDLWSVIDAPACTTTYPDYLPNVDMMKINGIEVQGAWLAINFTAEQVEYRPKG